MMSNRLHEKPTASTAVVAAMLVPVLVSALLASCAVPEVLTVTPSGGNTQQLPTGGRIVPAPAVAPPTPLKLSTCGATASLRPGSPSPDDHSLERIRTRDRLVVGIDQSTNLFSFRDPTTGVFAGFGVDIARQVAADLLGDPSKVEFRLLTFDDYIDAVQQGQVDIVTRATTITCERARHVAFSTVYFEANQRLLVTKGSGITGPADLAGKRVCSVTGSTSLATVQRVLPTATILGAPNQDDCLVSIQQDWVDAVSTDDSILAGMAAQDPNLEIVGPDLESEPYGIVMNKNDPDLVRFVNGTLERIRADGTWMRLYDHWYFAVMGPVAGPPSPTYRD
jgi:polar amino acid transport system substrate-binding protein